MERRRAVLAISIVAILLGAGIAWLHARARARDPFVSFADRVPASLDSALTPIPDERTLKFAIASMLSPESTFESYRAIVDYVGLRLGSPPTLVLRPGYRATRKLVEDGKVQVAFVCTGTYLYGAGSGRLELLVRPIPTGRLTYHCAVIVKDGSPVHARADLRGRTFAYTDPESLTGHLVPRRWIEEGGVDSGSFFREVLFTGSHERSIEAVSRGLVDAAAVDSLVLDAMRDSAADTVSRTRVLWRSEPFGEPPVVVPSSLDPELKAKLREIFLKMHETPTGRALLGAVQIERFAPAQPADYDSLVQLYRAAVNPNGRSG